MRPSPAPVEPSGGRPAPGWRGALDALGLSRAEAAALAILAAGAAAVLGIVWWTARHPAALPVPAPDVTTAPAETATEGVVVHVAGQVASPGIYALPDGARVADAVREAGGAGPFAALERVNLARRLSDGEQLVVPDRRDPVGPAGAAGAAPTPAARRPDGTLDLNLATAQDLQELPGIGPVLAGRIIDRREELGGFASVAQLQEVTGIGERRYLELVELVTVP